MDFVGFRRLRPFGNLRINPDHQPMIAGERRGAVVANPQDEVNGFELFNAGRFDGQFGARRRPLQIPMPSASLVIPDPFVVENVAIRIRPYRGNFA